MFHTKICGIKSLADIDAVSASGADAIGLNFFGPSVRSIDPDSQHAKSLSEIARTAGLIRVGLFVNEPCESILQVVQRLELDVIQLHGDESLDQVDDLKRQTELPILRAIKLPSNDLNIDQINSSAQPWIELGVDLLLDADAGAAHGGSGKTLDWDPIRLWSEQNSKIRWVLAGGLKPENVAEAVLASGAKSVDVASGVEVTKGIKSPQLIRRFVSERKNAVI